MTALRSLGLFLGAVAAGAGTALALWCVQELFS